MDEGVPGSAAPAPIFLGDMNSVEEILEPKRDTFDFLGFVVGSVVPPSLFAISIGVLLITDDVDLIWYVLCSGACIWPILALILTITAAYVKRNYMLIGALLSSIIWIVVIYYVYIKYIITL